MNKIMLIFTMIIFLLPYQIKAEIYSSISGRVTTDMCEPVEGITVVIQNYKFETVEDIIKYKGKHTVSRTITDKNGFYSFDLLPSDKYFIILEMPEKFNLYRELIIPSMPVQLPSGKNLIDVNIVISRYYGTISGKVFKSDGVTPYGEGEAIIFLTKDNKKEYTITNSHGEFSFKISKNKGVWKLVIDDDESDKIYIPDIDIDLSQPKDIKDMNIIFKEGYDSTGFYGSVKNIDGRVINDGYITIDSIKGLRFYSGLKIKSDGSYEIKGLPQGEYKFTILPPNEFYHGVSENELKYKLKKMIVDSTYIINFKGKREKIDLIYDDNKAILKYIGGVGYIIKEKDEVIDENTIR